MLLETIYSKLHNNGMYHASAFCVTRTHRVMEMTFFNKAIVNVKALGMTEEQVIKLFQTGDFKDVNIMPKETRLESVNDKIVEKLFPLAADYLFDPAYLTVSYVVRMLDIIEYISRNKSGPETVPAFSIMAKTLAERYPGFTMAKDILLRRFDYFEKVTGIALLSLNKQPVPSNDNQLLSWAFSRTATNDALMRTFVRYFLFWGELCPAFSRVIIREDKSFDHKPGTAGIVRKNELAQYQRVHLYKGLAKTGEFQLIEKKKGSYMSPEAARPALSVEDAHKGLLELLVSSSDLHSSGLRHGENIVCLFE